MHRVIHIFAMLRAPSRVNTCEDTLDIAKIKTTHCFAFSLGVPWYGSMESNMEENFSMEQKIASMEIEKIVSYSITCPAKKCFQFWHPKLTKSRLLIVHCPEMVNNSRPHSYFLSKSERSNCIVRW